MSRITSKLQVTVPRAVADRFGIKPGDKVEWLPAEDGVRVLAAVRTKEPDLKTRLRLFDEATLRQRDREKTGQTPSETAVDRGWRREDLYDRGLSD